MVLTKQLKLKKLLLLTWKPTLTPSKWLLKKLKLLLTKPSKLLAKLLMLQKALSTLLQTWLTLLLNNPFADFQKEGAWPAGRALFFCPLQMCGPLSPRSVSEVSAYSPPLARYSALA